MTDIKKVVGDKVDADGFPDGTPVIVQHPEETKPFQVTADEKQELLEAIRRADNGEGIDAFEHLVELRERLG